MKTAHKTDHACHYTGCNRPIVARATPLIGKAKPFHTCEDHIPGSRKPADAWWPDLYHVERL